MKFLHSPLLPLALLLIGAVAGWTFGSVDPTGTSISFLSVGQGDCTVLSSEGYTILIDDGPASPYENAAVQIIIPWLQRNGYHHVDAIFLSHPDEDHVGGTPALLDKYPGAKVVVSDEFQNDEEMTKRLREWKMDPAAVTWIPKFSKLEIGDTHVSIECPDRPAGGDANDGSMFMRVSEGSGSVVFSGDAPKNVERTVEQDENWKTEIVHVGHHGSHTASDQTWLEKLRPAIAIISVGRHNRYGHPSQQTLDRLAADHIQTYRTDRDGSVTFRFADNTFVKG